MFSIIIFSLNKREISPIYEEYFEYTGNYDGKL